MNCINQYTFLWQQSNYTPRFRYFCQKKYKYCTVALLFQCISNSILNSCYYYFFYATAFIGSLLYHALKNLHEVICYFFLWFQRRKLWKKAFNIQLTNQWEMPEAELTQNMKIGVSSTAVAQHCATVIPTDLYTWISSAEILIPHLWFHWTPSTASRQARVSLCKSITKLISSFTS